MPATDAQPKKEMLSTIAEATDAIGLALASLGEAYEQLDEQTADRLEEQLFRPVQRAYGRLSQTHSAFAQRSELRGRTFVQPNPGRASTGARGFIEIALDEVGRADMVLSELQDSMAPVEYGDQELRAGLSGARELLDTVSANARQLTRTLGR